MRDRNGLPAAALTDHASRITFLETYHESPLSWLRDFVPISLSPEELAYKLTFGGLEVEELEYVGLAPRDGPRVGGLPGAGTKGSGPAARGLAWDPAKIVVAAILEVMPHPNADRLTLLR